MSKTKAVILRSSLAPPPPAARVHVVIVVEPDGFLRAFAPDQVEVRFVQLLNTGTADGRTAAEDYARLSLPPSHRGIAFDARFSRGVFKPTPLTAQGELDRRIAAALVRSTNRECRG